MGFRAAVCPSCSKDVQVPDDVDRAACMYCGATIDLTLPASDGAATPGVTNLLGMAKTAELAGNSAEAMGYFNRVLEIDPRLSEAWLGKGKAAGWQSTMGNIRLPETVVAFGHAIATASPAEKASVTAQAVEEVNKIAVAIYTMSRNHMLEFVTLDGTWGSYLNQVSQILEALDNTQTWSPDDTVTLENIVHLCKDNIEGVTFRDRYNQNAPGAWHLSPEYEQLLKGKLVAAVERIKQIDSDYQAPVIEKKQADSCFVITATMGDFNHLTVTLLRKFRDQHLLKNTLGRNIVNHYYVVGPFVARFIEKSSFAKRLSFALIVMPAEWIARAVMRR